MKNQEAVNNFLQNLELQSFLSDRPAQDPARHGCNLTIRSFMDDNGDHCLLVQRNTSQNSIDQVVCMDLLSTLNTYICPEGANDSNHASHEEWILLATGLSPLGNPIAPQNIVIKDFQRGQQFIQDGPVVEAGQQMQL